MTVEIIVNFDSFDGFYASIIYFKDDSDNFLHFGFLNSVKENHRRKKRDC